MTDVIQFGQETGQYGIYNEFVNQQQEYFKNLTAQGGVTLGEGTPLFLDTFKNVKSLFGTGQKFVSQASTLKADTEKAFERGLTKLQETGEKALTKVQSVVGEGVQKSTAVVKDVLEHAKEQGQQLLKSSFDSVDELKSTLSGLTSENKSELQSLQNRFSELRQQLADKKSAGILNDEEAEKLGDEARVINSRVAKMLGTTEKYSSEGLRKKVFGEHIKEFLDMPELEEAKESVVGASKSVLSKQAGFLRDRMDRALESRTQTKFQEYLDEDPEDVDRRFNIISERDKAIESTRQEFNPVSQKYESVKSKAESSFEESKAKVDSTLKEGKAKAESVMKEGQAKAEGIVKEGQAKASELTEKVGQEVGKVKGEFEEAGKAMIEKGEETAKAGVKAISETGEGILSKGVEAGKSVLAKGTEAVGELSKIGSEVAENVAKAGAETAEAATGGLLETLGPVGELAGTGMLLYQGIKDLFEGAHHAPTPMQAAPVFTPNI